MTQAMGDKNQQLTGFRRYCQGLAVLLLIIAAIMCMGGLWGSWYFGTSLRVFMGQGMRVLLTPVYARMYQHDLQDVAVITARYRVGNPQLLDASAVASWHKIEREIKGFGFQSTMATVDRVHAVPFVYEPANAPFLSDFRQRFRLDEVVAGAPDEYSAMLKLAAWLGTRWEHGTDPLEGTTKVCDPVGVVEAGERGAKFWCEVAARTTVHAASALGWPGRVITASRDGYTWEHAVAELWSNQFNKWFVVDTDFNVVYERGGVPLSAFELSRDGLQLQRDGLLDVHMFAPSKPNLPNKDLMPFYRYVHVDLRNDWCIRTLNAGSPAGGDLATWWTARPSMKRLLSSKVRMDDMRQFNWQVNGVGIHAIKAETELSGEVALTVGLVAYSPVFKSFEVSIDDGEWQVVDGTTLQRHFSAGAHQIRSRLMTISGYPGPASRVMFTYGSPANGEQHG